MDSEVLSVIVELNDLAQVHVMNYVTVYFGLVVAAYFVADKLPPFVVVSILVVFTLFTILNLTSLYDIAARTLELAELYDSKIPPLWKTPEIERWYDRALVVSLALMYLFSYTSGIGFTVYRMIKGSSK